MKNVENYESFNLNDEKINAVILNLEQIRETAKKLSDDEKILILILSGQTS